MRLHSIRLVNYRCFRDISVDLKPTFNVIAGTNGSGKTSLLKGICESLKSFHALLDDHLDPLSDPSDVRLDVVEYGKRPRFERQYPVRVHAGAAVLGEATAWTVRRDSQLQPSYYEGQSPAGLFKPQKRDAISGAAITFPVLAFYHADRNWRAATADAIQAATARDSRFDGYVEWSDAAANGATFQRWLIAKCLERIQYVSESGNEYSQAADDELSLVNSAVRKAVEDTDGLRYDFGHKSLIIDWAAVPGRADRSSAFENLSDGQRTIICLVADIARRMCLLNPHLGMNVIKETPGVILIDELDVHLHPRWQRLLVHSLKAVFPAVQFITTSHSPQILGELQPEEIILLHHDRVDHPRISYGLDSSRVLEEIMGADARPEAVEALIRQVFSALEDKDLSIARAKIAALRALAPGLPELVGAEALLKRKEAIGR